MSNEALKRAVEVVGSQAKLGEMIGVPQQKISYWLTVAKNGTAAEFVLAIEGATGGTVTRHELRPDLYPKETNQAETAA